MPASPSLRRFIPLAIFCLVLPFAHADTRILPGGTGDPCADLLLKIRALKRLSLIRAFQAAEITQLSHKGGILVMPATARGNSMIDVVIRERLIQPPSEWPHQHWTLRGEKYFFGNYGFKNLDQDSDEVNWIIARHLLHAPDKVLQIYYGPQRIREVDLLRTLRWRIHRRVLGVYEEAKEYLSPNDLWTLEQINRASSNSDVFAVFREDPLLDLAGLEKNLLLTVQVTYPEQKNHFLPGVNDILRSSGLPPVEDSAGMLPFEYRLSHRYLNGFRRRFHSRFDIDATAEVTRYAKFLRELPREINDAVLYSVVHAARDRGIKTLVMAGDDFTMRLFIMRYGAKLYARLPSRSPGPAEYVGYIDLDSEHFRPYLERLANAAEQIAVR